MVTLPKEFVATRHPGYFWNTQDHRLYSVKVTGMLKPLVMQKPNFFNHQRAGWQVSVNGNKRFLSMDELKAIKPKSSVFPVYQD